MLDIEIRIKNIVDAIESKKGEDIKVYSNK